MNCIRCNDPLPPDARFCRNCGAPVSINVPPPQPPQLQAQVHSPTPQPYYQPTLPVSPETLQSSSFAGQRPQNLASRRDMPPRRRRGRGLRFTLITLVVLIILLAGAWVFVLRPYLHSLAQNQVDSALSNAVNQIDFSLISQAPPGVPLPPVKVTEDAINNFYLPLIHNPSSPVQNMHIQIASNQVRLDFTVYGFASDVTGKPTLQNGNLTVTNVSVGGIAGLVMSSDEMTALLNRHLADIQSRLHRPINSVLLMNHELDIILG